METKQPDKTILGRPMPRREDFQGNHYLRLSRALDKVEAERDRLRAENERLREALEKIANGRADRLNCQHENLWEVLRDLARAALAATKPEKREGGE